MRRGHPRSLCCPSVQGAGSPASTLSKMMRCPDRGADLDKVPVDQPCPKCGSARRDATPRPPTVEATAAVPPPSILMKHHAWITWAEIAIDHEAEARRVRFLKPAEEFRPGLVAITAAAFALDAFYGVAEQLVPDPGTESPRGAVVAERLKQGVAGGPKAYTWPLRIKALFKTRREAVHFGEAAAPPVMHDALNSHVSPEVFSWRLEAAQDAVDLVLEVFETWVENPSKLTKDWAAAYGHAVAGLVRRRQESENGAL